VIDIHSHLLWDLDDGPGTFEDSLAMLRLAAETGTTDIVATPHANSRFPFRPELIDERIAALRESAGGSIGIHLGCDFHLHYGNIQDALRNPSKYTIAHKSYLLVEFSDTFVARQIDAVFAKMREAGMAPIITHPERSFALQQRIEDLSRWVSEGCLLQITAQSLLGRFGSASQRFARLLLKRKLVHIVASDAHDCRDRPPRLDLAYKFVARDYGAEVAQRLFVHYPGMVLAGRPIDSGDAGNQPDEGRRRRWSPF
jgi:protein-tyrosine phosphatase